MLPIQKDVPSGVALGSKECSIDSERIVSGAERKRVPDIKRIKGLNGSLIPTLRTDRKKEWQCDQQLSIVAYTVQDKLAIHRIYQIGCRGISLRIREPL